MIQLFEKLGKTLGEVNRIQKDLTYITNELSKIDKPFSVQKSSRRGRPKKK